jgi:ornithine cyclodeaminase/alanine dehydrogenase-like protein (mu-crystallin family)
VLILDRGSRESLLDLDSVVEAVEQCLRAHALGKTVMPSKTYLALPEHGGDFRAMAADREGAAGLHWV